MKIKCNYCGFEGDSPDGFCPNCGSDVKNQKTNSTVKDNESSEHAKITPVEHKRPSMVIPNGIQVNNQTSNSQAQSNQNVQFVQATTVRTNPLKDNKKLLVFSIIMLSLAFIATFVALILPGVSVTDGTYTATLSVFDYLAGSNSTCINPSYFSLRINITTFYGYILAAVFLLSTTLSLSNNKVLNFIHFGIAVLTLSQSIVYISDVYNVAYLFSDQNTNIYFFGLLFFLIANIINTISALVNTGANIKEIVAQ